MVGERQSSKIMCRTMDAGEEERQRWKATSVKLDCCCCCFGGRTSSEESAVTEIEL